MARIKRDWTSLPEGLLALIAELLPSQNDLCCLRAVCRSFRSELPPSTTISFPQSILTTTDFLKGPNPSTNGLYVLIESTAYAVRPLNKKESPPWLIKVEKTKPGKVEIKDPLSILRFRFPRKLPKFLNLLDYKVTEITTSYALETTAILKGKPELAYGGKYSQLEFSSGKVIFTSGIDESDEEFAVMVKFGVGRLSLWRNVDKKWSKIDLEIDLGIDFEISTIIFMNFNRRLVLIEDIIYHDKKFYVLLSRGVTMTVDSKSLSVTEVAGTLNDLKWYKSVYLLESHNNLFLFAKFSKNLDTEDYLKVFKLDKERHEWFRVEKGLEFEDRAIFLSEDGSFSLSAKESSE
ncbi:F-box/kelch-repeat protein At1g64840-like [Pistacia vera]|uniref:F-box/kelch-repeat protein At1g64840-like n=1 Tax=Pistacia vera TaxID=55513 RepID=UPI001262BA3A|nr:F-box/kelch-repeat protein At1g64840-like [Pistacia vera]